MRPLPAVLPLAAVLLCLPFTSAQTLTVLHSFQPPDGGAPMAGVIEDTAGNLYGATAGHGADGDGTVFQLAPGGAFTVLHNFGATAADGVEPAAPLLLGADGSLYGTTVFGGAECGPDPQGCGTVFKITSSGNESVIHDFEGGQPSSPDGVNPFSSLIADRSRNVMYGTTSGGVNGSVVYQITPAGKETILYTSKSLNLFGPLVQDVNGDLWGTAGGDTLNPCASTCGAVFRLHRTPRGWVETTTYAFTGLTDGANPTAGLVYDPRRHVFYGVAPWGGANGFGTLFELDSTGTKLTVLRNFDLLNDGGYPSANLILDPLGDVYGVTPGGGPSQQGTAFVYTFWGQFMVLHDFNSNEGVPQGSLLLDSGKMALYGTTFNGGAFPCFCGVVYSITP